MAIQLENQSSSTEIKSKNFSIRKNVINIGSYVLNLRNISSVNSGKVVPDYPWKTIIALVVLALVLMAFNPLISILPIAYAIYIGFSVYNQQQNPKQYLYFIMNNGQMYNITVDNQAFREKIIEAVENNMNGLGGIYQVNIENNQIETQNNGKIFNQVGSNNGQLVQGYMNSENFNQHKIDYDELVKNIVTAKQNYKEESEQYQALSELETVVMTKDNGKISDFISKSKVLTVDFLKAVVPQIIANLITNN
ncbi:hypothetical protein [Leuconostoc pseudomesenteroides]|uniref:hypothetical protein n=1 Tax=Leuconostoc pseudomesenteroides TaxID=33968 RepID=UPI0032DF6F3A